MLEPESASCVFYVEDLGRSCDDLHRVRVLEPISDLEPFF